MALTTKQRIEKARKGLMGAMKRTLALVKAAPRYRTADLNDLVRALGDNINRLDFDLEDIERKERAEYNVRHGLACPID